MIQLQWHGETTTFRTYSYAQYDAKGSHASLLTTSVIVIKYDEKSSFCQSAKQRNRVEGFVQQESNFEEMFYRSVRDKRAMSVSTQFCEEEKNFRTEFSSAFQTMRT